MRNRLSGGVEEQVNAVTHAGSDEEGVNGDFVVSKGMGVGL